MRNGQAESDRPLICVTCLYALVQKGVMPMRRTLPPRSREEIAAQIRAQFTYATFDAFDYLNDQRLMRAIDRGKPVTVREFRALARKHGWSNEWLIACIEDDMAHADRAVRRVLHREPAQSTDIPRPLLNLYWRFKDVTPEQLVAGLCWCGCGEKVRGRQRYASQACQKRCYRRAA
jgi:hypothetical protein